MQGISKALKCQRLRKLYSEGVNVSPLTVDGTGDKIYITNLKNGSTFWRGMVAKNQQGDIIEDRDP